MDINIRLARFLVIMDLLAYSKTGKYILNNDRLIIFDFLLRYPFILKKVVEVKNEKLSIKLNNEEIGSITTLYPSNSALLDTKSTKNLIKLMLSYNLMSIQIDKSEMFYILTDNGKMILSELDTEYIRRMKELCNAMIILKSTTINELRKIIKPLIRGV